MARPVLTEPSAQAASAAAAHKDGLRAPRRQPAPPPTFSAARTALETVEGDFRAVLSAHGIHWALAILNERTRYRFTGVYRVDPPALRNEHLFDRENPTLAFGGDVCDLKNTYCGIVAATRAAFAAGDTRTDSRLTRHPSRESVLSYIGVPVMCTTGVVIGTLCHFDLRPRILKLDELSVLEAIAPCISEWLTRQLPPS